MQDPAASPGQVRGSERRRRRHAVPISARRSVYDWVAIIFLMGASVVGPFLFGAVRLWSICPLMLLVFLAGVMFFARPMIASDLRRLQPPPGVYLWLIFWIYGLVMIPRAASPFDAWVEMLKMASYITAYWVWAELASHHRRWRIILAVPILAVTFIAWYAIIQHAHGTRMVLNLERPDGYGMRASGTYICPNHFAALLETVMPLCLALLFMAAADIPLRLLAGYALMLFLPVMFLTQSRSGWIGTVVGLSVTALLMALRKSRRLFLVLLLAVPLLVAGAGVGVWTFSPVARERLQGALLSSPDSAVQARLDLWKDTIPMIKAAPWLGHGGGSYVWVYPQFKSQAAQLLFNYAHNEYLHYAADYGLVGLALFGVFAGGALWAFLRVVWKASRDRDAFLAAGLLGAVAAQLAHALFDFNLHIFSNNHLLMLVAGTTAATMYAVGDFKPKSVRSPFHYVVWGAAAVLCAWLAMESARIFLSYGFHRLGDGKRERFDMDGAMRDYRRAAVVYRGNWRPYIGMGHVRQTQGFWSLVPEDRTRLSDEAVGFYQEAMRRNPKDMEPVAGLSKAWNVLGEQEKALECLQRAVETERQHQFYVTQLGLQLRRMGRYEEALRVFREADEKWNSPAIDINIRYLQGKLAPAPADAPAVP